MVTEKGASCTNNLKGKQRKLKLIERKKHLEDTISCMQDQIEIINHEISLC